MPWVILPHWTSQTADAKLLCIMVYSQIYPNILGIIPTLRLHLMPLGIKYKSR